MTSSPPAPDDAALRLAYGSTRVSRQRLELARCAAGLGRAFTAEELHERALGTLPGLGMATTYRAIAAMTFAGALAAVGERDGRALYAWCAERGEHHHHFVCTRCGRVERVDCPLPGDALDGARHGGRTVTRHELTLYGLCASCQTEEER